MSLLDEEYVLQLENLRSALIRQEETIIFSLIERAQFAYNPQIYKRGGIPVPGFEGSFQEFLLLETEKLHAKVCRFTSPDEHSYFERSLLPTPIIPTLPYPPILKENTISVNAQILQMYIQDILPTICASREDKNYGSSAVNDLSCLQALSKRIHYGKFVAESKFREDPAGYEVLIKNKDEAGIMAKLTNSAVEERLLKRVEKKAATYGQDYTDDSQEGGGSFKVQPSVVADLYRRFIIPLTKDVEVLYLLDRLSTPAADACAPALKRKRSTHGDDVKVGYVPHVRAAAEQWNSLHEDGEAQLFAYTSISEVFEAVRGGAMTVGVVPEHMGADGVVHSVLDLVLAAITPQPPVLVCGQIQCSEKEVPYTCYALSTKLPSKTGHDTSLLAVKGRISLSTALAVVNKHTLITQMHVGKGAAEPWHLLMVQGHVDEATIASVLRELLLKGVSVSVVGVFSS